MPRQQNPALLAPAAAAAAAGIGSAAAGELVRSLTSGRRRRRREARETNPKTDREQAAWDGLLAEVWKFRGRPRPGDAGAVLSKLSAFQEIAERPPRRRRRRNPHRRGALDGLIGEIERRGPLQVGWVTDTGMYVVMRGWPDHTEILSRHLRYTDAARAAAAAARQMTGDDDMRTRNPEGAPSEGLVASMLGLGALGAQGALGALGVGLWILGNRQRLPLALPTGPVAATSPINGGLAPQLDSSTLRFDSASLPAPTALMTLPDWQRTAGFVRWMVEGGSGTLADWTRPLTSAERRTTGKPVGTTVQELYESTHGSHFVS